MLRSQHCRRCSANQHPDRPTAGLFQLILTKPGVFAAKVAGFVKINKDSERLRSPAAEPFSGEVRLPAVRHVDDDARSVPWPVEVERPEGEPSPDSKANGGLSFEAAAPGDLPECTPSLDVDDLGTI